MAREAEIEGGFGGVEGCWLGDGRQQSAPPSLSLYLSLLLALCSLSFHTLWVLFACYSPWHCGDMAFNRLPGVKQTTSINSSVSALASAEPLTPVAPLAFSVCACMHVCTCLSVYIPEWTHATVCECGCMNFLFYFFSHRKETVLISTAMVSSSNTQSGLNRVGQCGRVSHINSLSGPVLLCL